MKWQRKAWILRICASLPGAGPCYKFLQKRLGRLSDNPENRLPMVLEMGQWLVDAGRPIAGATFFEVGTGHLPTVPVCLSLLGAEKVITVDLYRRMDLDVLRGLLNRLSDGRETYARRLAPIAGPAGLAERFDLLQRLKDDPRAYLEAAGIVYLAPCDAARTGLPDASVDCHLSVTVFEHIPPPVLAAIMKEARRIVKDTGCAIHFIDPSDHFEHQDHSISRTNFLRFSPEEWKRIAGNQFAYTNRLRSSELARLFTDAGFTILRQEDSADPKGIAPDFPLHPAFAAYDRADLSIINVKLLAVRQ